MYIVLYYEICYYPAKLYCSFFGGVYQLYILSSIFRQSGVLCIVFIAIVVITVNVKPLVLH